MAFSKYLCIGLISAIVAFARLTPSSAVASSSSGHELEIIDRVPKFVAFYNKATATPLDADARWTLWKKDYDIAAVPPGPDGDKMARHLLDTAWPEYPALMPKLPTLKKEAETDAHQAFDRINTLFSTGDVSIQSRLVLYVGQFDNNAYTVPPMNGQPVTVMMPIENASLRLGLAHELAHSVNIQLAHVQNSFGAPVGETMFLEGLAMRTVQRIFPGLPETSYTQVSGDDTWLAQCYEKKTAVLDGIAPDLEKSGPEVAMKYTFGSGNTGMQREAYCAAWIVMGKLLHSGHTFPELARVPKSKMVAAIRSVMTVTVDTGDSGRP